VEIHFSCSWDENDPTDGYLRYDNPKSTAENPAPLVMETRKLDYIEIKISDTLISKFSFDYNTTDRVYSDDYDGIYYSGKHSLISITQVGADGTSELPSMTFTYQDLQTYRHGSEGEDEYSGNPGNPASFDWPHLTEVNSGYGGTINFSYTQIPDTSATGIWTREVVTDKTIDGGIGTAQEYTYAYTGNPQYLGLGWDQKYRGFNEVEETDSAGNYIKHWFYTTGKIDDKDAERLSGKEYKTQWYNSGEELLREQVYDWEWYSTSEIWDFDLQWSHEGTGDGLFDESYGIAVSSDRYVYATDYDDDGQVHKFDEHDDFILKWGSGDGTGDGELNDPKGVAISSGGYIYVVDNANNRVQKFDDDGDFILSWGSYGTGDGQFDSPRGIAVSSDGYVYVADSDNDRVQKFDDDGDFILKWGSYGTGDGQFNNPGGIAVSSDGYIYVIDQYNHRVQKFDDDGDFILKWGSRGTGDGRFDSPGGIAVSSDGYVYVSDTNNHRVQKFDDDGDFILKWGSLGTGDGQFKYPRDVTVSSDGYVYVSDTTNHRIQKFDDDGDFILKWGDYGTGDGQFRYPRDVAISSDGYVYVTDDENARVQKFDDDGDFILEWGSYGTGDGEFKEPCGIAVSSDGYVYVIDHYNHRVQKFDDDGDFILKWGSYGTGDGQFKKPYGIAVSSDGHIYVADTDNDRIQKFDADGNFVFKWSNENGFSLEPDSIALSASDMYCTGETGVHELMYNWAVRLSGVEETIGSKTSRTRYAYDDYGNVIAIYLDGDLDTNDDDSIVQRVFYPNEELNILGMPAEERVYDAGENLKSEILYYYDDNDLTDPPDEGNLTRLEQKIDASNSVNSYFTYDAYGNMLTRQDPNENITTWTYETTHHTYPDTITSPVAGLSESYTYDPGTLNILSITDFNDQTTTYQYDTFKRLIKVIKPGDSEESPSIEYQYNDWGTLNQQNLKTLTKVTEDDYLWQSQYFDGLGRVLQVQACGETGRTIISATTAYNNVGLLDKSYVSQDMDSSEVDGYMAPEASWKYTYYEYDGLGRVIAQTYADGTTVSHDYSTAWQEVVTDERGYEKNYYFDAFGRLIKVEELDDSYEVYATTEYSYDVMGNLVQVEDSDSNTIAITYDWLSRKTAMADPDMGSWSYSYDDNGNLISQTDAKGQTITFTYDELNRLTAKSYPQGSGMTDVTYTYDSTIGGNYGKGQRTGMTDAIGTTGYKYDNRGRPIEEKRTIDSADYTTQFAYDGADRVTSIIYPTGETVTQEYNGRGLPYSLSGSVVGELVTSTLYNYLGQINEIHLGNGLGTTYGYWDVGTIYDTTGGYYGKLWRVQTAQAPWHDSVVQDEKYTWDAAGNMTQREDVLAEETETFTYDFLDRLTSASGPYSESYTYDEIGNITSKNGVAYTYGSQPHAVTAVGETSYTYDANGNMTVRDSQTLTWDVENRPVSITDGESNSTFVYDGNGNRVMKTEGGETILYVNKYYEKNLTTEEETTYYYHGGKLVAKHQGTELSYIHQDHLASTSVMTDSTGNELGTINYFPFGECRNSTGTIDTDKLFTGQRLDGTGLYYYGARYYDPTIGRFISADTIVPDPANPQSLNRYSYCLNNPLKYTDSTGEYWSNPWEILKGMADSVVNTVKGIAQAVMNPVQTYESMKYAVTHPVETWNSISSNYTELWSTDRGRGEILGEFTIALFTVGAGATASTSSKAASVTRTVTSTGSKASKALVPYENPKLLPPNGGALGAWSKETLNPGTLIDRYGSAAGKYTSPKGTPIEMRSLSPNTTELPYNTYRVTKALEVDSSTIRPWYGQFGYGTQYRLPDTVDNLIRSGYLEFVP
jgi:RHS repeat-associated protein